MALIKICDLRKIFNQKTVLSGIDLEVEKGDIKVIMGPSGCGKTTLMLCLNRLVEPTSGAIYFHSVDITKPETNIRALRKKIGFVFQNFALYRHLSVLDNITLGLRKLNGMSRAEAKEKALHELDKFEMASHGDKYPSQISGGQKQRVALARALAMNPEVLIFDEPTSALDPVMTREVASIINKLHDGRVTILCVTHDVLLAEQISDKIVFLDKGIIKAEGNVNYFSKDHSDIEIRNFFGRNNDA